MSPVEDDLPGLIDWMDSVIAAQEETPIMDGECAKDWFLRTREARRRPQP